MAPEQQSSVIRIANLRERNRHIPPSATPARSIQYRHILVQKRPRSSNKLDQITEPWKVLKYTQRALFLVYKSKQLSHIFFVTTIPRNTGLYMVAEYWPRHRSQRDFLLTRFQIGHLQWSHVAYTTIRQLHILKGFDPAIKDPARSLDLPLLEAVRDETRFEEIKAQSIEDFQPMDVNSELAVLLSTLTVDAAEDAMEVD
uniref:Uncharacterized protein n=1 Tax=Moniliophthora roreri TaxID=221103 RepID=A0A0W0EV07_MONRR